MSEFENNPTHQPFQYNAEKCAQLIAHARKFNWCAIDNNNVTTSPVIGQIIEALQERLEATPVEYITKVVVETVRANVPDWVMILQRRMHYVLPDDGHDEIQKALNHLFTGEDE